jgi:hypothetical protein
VSCVSFGVSWVFSFLDFKLSNFKVEKSPCWFVQQSQTLKVRRGDIDCVGCVLVEFAWRLFADLRLAAGPAIAFRSVKPEIMFVRALDH